MLCVGTVVESKYRIDGDFSFKHKPPPAWCLVLLVLHQPTVILGPVTPHTLGEGIPVGLHIGLVRSMRWTSSFYRVL